MTEDVLVIRNLTKKFGNFTAVDDISFSVKRGEVFGFLGANGAGKTTTIRMICALLEPTAGEIELDGMNVWRFPEKTKKRIGYMSQKFSLYQDLTPFENMDFFAEIYDVDENTLNQAKELLAHELNMTNLDKILTKQLPLGYKQRLALRTTLLHDPPILFLDEATSGVDPRGRRQFWDEIYNLSASGKTIFVTTHYMDEAEYCHRLSIMDRGKIVETGIPSELKKKHKVKTMQDVFMKAIRI